jgi:hypothetical protein
VPVKSESWVAHTATLTKEESQPAHDLTTAIYREPGIYLRQFRRKKTPGLFNAHDFATALSAAGKKAVRGGGERRGGRFDIIYALCVLQEALLLNAFPEPDLKYRSSLRAALTLPQPHMSEESRAG